MTRERSLLLNDMPALKAVASWRAMMRRPHEVRLGIPGMTEVTRNYWQMHLNRYLSACGCAAAALFFAIGLAGYLSHLHRNGELTLSWGNVVVGLVVIGLATLLGRAFGLLLAQLRLSIVVRRLEREQSSLSFGRGPGRASPALKNS